MPKNAALYNTPIKIYIIRSPWKNKSNNSVSKLHLIPFDESQLFGMKKYFNNFAYISLLV